MNDLGELKNWLDLSCLCLNEQKTEIVVFGGSDHVEDCAAALGPVGLFTPSCVKNLGVIFGDADKSDLYRQITTVVKTSSFQLRLLGKVKPYLSNNDFERVMHDYITTQLDYCKYLYLGLDQSFCRLQLEQNAAIWFLAGTFF